jgi:GNAT superfamily N-acetyltransferase
VDWLDSRLQIICGCRPHLEKLPVLVREASMGDRVKALELFRRYFSPAQLVLGGEPLPLDDAMLLVAEAENEVAGALAWRPADGALQIIALATDPMWQRAGVGGYLVAEAEIVARRHNWKQVLVTITNDNLPALYFYQRRSYRMSAVTPDSSGPHARHGKAIGFAGIPIQDEIQLVKRL